MEAEVLKIPIRSDKFSLNIKVKEHFFHAETEFQEIDFYDTDAFGKVMLLDGHIQLTELDEHAYHEALVHIPALSLRSLKRALVVGGGDGGVVRELVKHSSLEHVDMVEIDEGVIRACGEHMAWVSAGAFQDPRVSVHVGDAFQFVKGNHELYDLIVVDSTDVYEDEEENLSEQLFTSEFYSDCSRLLADHGLVVAQADNLVFFPFSLRDLLKMYSAVFPRTGSYQAVVPSFGGFSGYVWASKGASVSEEFPKAQAAEMDLRYLNEATWAYAFTPLSYPLPDR